MSNLREKAREIREAGEQERGLFEATGAPLRAYQYWLQNGKSPSTFELRNGTKKENFCHFWRVVALWAPLTFVKKKFESAMDSKVFWAIIAAFALLGLTTAGIMSGGFREVLFVLVLALVGTAAIVGMLFGVYAALDYASDGEGDKWFGRLGVGLLVLAAMGFIGYLVYELILAAGWWALWGALIGLAGIGVLVGLILVASTVAGYYRAKRKDRPVVEQTQVEDEFDPEFIDYEAVEREPGRFQLAVQRFLRGLGDWLILIGQIVRVKKWKICPLVEIDTTPKAEV